MRALRARARARSFLLFLLKFYYRFKRRARLFLVLLCAELCYFSEILSSFSNFKFCAFSCATLCSELCYFFGNSCAFF